MSVIASPKGDFVRMKRGETLTVGNVVALGENDDEVIQADHRYSDRMPGRGFVRSISGDYCIVQRDNAIALSSLEQQKPYWVSTNGGIQNTPPQSGSVQEVGSAISSTKFLIEIQPIVYTY